MKKKIFTRFYMLAMLILFATSSLQAQIWTNSQSLMMNTDVVVDLQAQKVQEYGDKYLITISKKTDSSNYCFSSWIIGSNVVHNSFLNTSDITINDFTILGDSLYFCGNRKVSQNLTLGILGRFNINDFLDDGNFGYNFAYLADTENLTKLVAYYTQGDTVCLMAIGHDTISDTTIGRITLLKFETSSTSPDYEIIKCPFVSYTQKEVMHDISLLDNEIITLSHIHPTNMYVLRYFKRQSSFDNTYNVYYTFPNLQFNVSSDVYEFPLHFTNISDLKNAVCVSIIKNQEYFTMVNILKNCSDYVFSTQLVLHKEKLNKALEMDYSVDNKEILLLNNTYSGQQMYQPMVHLDAESVTNYYAIEEIFDKPNQLNHFFIIPNGKYAVAGVRPLSQTSGEQLLSVKDINPLENDCVSMFDKEIDVIHVPDGNWNNISLLYLQYGGAWNSGGAFDSSEPINVYCAD